MDKLKSFIDYSLGPIAIHALTKITDFIKSGIAHWWLKKEKWLVNLAAESKQKK